MDKRHQRIFNEQVWYSKEVIHPLFGYGDYSGNRILEIGCAEGGGLHFFANNGAECYGIEYSHSRFLNAVEESNSVGSTIIHGDILNPDTYQEKIRDKFDYIIMRDVIEHIYNQDLALNNIKKLLKPGGKLFISFPPKYSPFAGHQQNSSRKIGKLPFIHLLPTMLYRLFMKIILENKEKINSLLDIKKTRISIYRFEKILKKKKLVFVQRDFYFVRPCFDFRYGIKKRKNFFKSIPILKEIFTLGASYILENDD